MSSEFNQLLHQHYQLSREFYKLITDMKKKTKEINEYNRRAEKKLHDSLEWLRNPSSSSFGKNSCK